MSIRTLYTEEHGAITLLLVEIIDPNTSVRSVAWEFHCDACDEYHNGLTESQARDEATTHRHHGHAHPSTT